MILRVFHPQVDIYLTTMLEIDLATIGRSAPTAIKIIDYHSYSLLYNFSLFGQLPSK